jgi:hypothetical protein
MIVHLCAVRLEGRAARIPISADDVAADIDQTSIFMSPTNSASKSATYSYLLMMQKWEAASIGIARALAVTTNVPR